MKFTLISFLLLLSGMCVAQKNRTIGFYNVENLFDVTNGENDDEDFLPEGKMEWTESRFNEKIDHINKVMDLMNNPALIGFCEIENREVVKQIMSYDSKRSNYGIVHYESTDQRGIDVALAFDKSVFNIIESGFIRFSINAERPQTRDIVWGKFIQNKDTVFALVNHWPSRRGGQVESEPNRVKAATYAVTFIDSVMAISPNSKIVLMGDLNDYPENLAPQIIAESLTPMITSNSGSYGGTHNYRGEWNVLDHIYVSKNFTKGKGVKVVKKSGKIISDDLLITEYKGNKVPFRTYGGTKYLGGYSDHLPVTIDVLLSK